MIDVVSIAAPAAPPPPIADDPAAVAEAERLALAVVRAERRLRTFEEISEIGMRLLRGLENPPAKDEASDKPRLDPALAFAKLSRAVRLTLELEARAEETLRAAIAGEMTADATRGAARERLAREADADQQQRAVARVADQVFIAIARETETKDDYDERSAALDERLDWDVAYDDVRGRPFREVVEQLCEDLDLTPDWSDWTDDGWPDPPQVGRDARPHHSPFRAPSPWPILKRTLEKPKVPGVLELADPP